MCFHECITRQVHAARRSDDASAILRHCHNIRERDSTFSSTCFLAYSFVTGQVRRGQLLFTPGCVTVIGELIDCCSRFRNLVHVALRCTVCMVHAACACGILHKHKANKVSFGRSSAGIEPKALMLGSEGCLGVITSAVIKIWPLAEEISHESVLFPSFGRQCTRR